MLKMTTVPYTKTFQFTWSSVGSGVGGKKVCRVSTELPPTWTSEAYHDKGEEQKQDAEHIQGQTRPPETEMGWQQRLAAKTLNGHTAHRYDVRRQQSTNPKAGEDVEGLQRSAPTQHTHSFESQVHSQ